MLKKILVTRIGAQDEGFAFSPDGKYLYNVEKPKNSTETRLTEYDYIHKYKAWEKTGFIEKALDLSDLSDFKEIKPVTLKGDYNNVVGFPMARLYQELKRIEK